MDSSYSVFALLLSAHIRSGGRIFFDGMPYDPGAPYGSIFWTYLINLALFATLAVIVFIAVREFGALAKWKRTIPYCLITVALGIPIDLLFLLLADKYYIGLSLGYPHGFAEFLSDGYSLTFLIAPSLIILPFLFFVQVTLIHLFYKEISFRKTLIISGLISLLTLPTWGTLLLLAVHRY